MKNKVIRSLMFPVLTFILIAASYTKAAEPPTSPEELHKRSINAIEERIHNAERRVKELEMEWEETMELGLRAEAGSLRVRKDKLKGKFVPVTDPYKPLLSAHEKHVDVCKKLDQARTELISAKNEALRLRAMPLQTCANCKKQGYDFRRCRTCKPTKPTYYCSPECQQQDWPKHQLTEWQCSICLDYDDGSKTGLGCGHSFHKKCIQEWRAKGGTTCPLCREPIIERTCAFCNQKGYDFKKCSACKVTYYCSPECQKKDWSEHKFVCKKLGTK